MRAKTISTIRDMLKQKRDDAHRDYKALRQKLEQKYDTEWLTFVNLEHYEQEVLAHLKEDYDAAREIFEDFEQHQW